MKISAERVEPFEGKTAASVRAIGLSNPLKTAIEKAAGEINPNLDDKLIQQLQSEDPLKYVKNYSILNETTVEKEYKIWIEANGDSEKLGNRFAALAGVSSKPFSRPSSISILVLQGPLSGPIIKDLSLPEVKREIAVALIGSGYKIVEPPADIILHAYVSLETTEYQTDNTEVVTTSYVLENLSSPHIFTVYRSEAPMYYVLGSVFIRAEDEDGNIITEVSESAYSNGPDLRQIGLEVLKSAGAKVAGTLKSEFDKRWNVGVTINDIRHDNNNGTIGISFTDLRSYSQYEKLNNALMISDGKRWQ
jgi:hypothetical protein